MGKRKLGDVKEDSTQSQAQTPKKQKQNPNQDINKNKNQKQDVNQNKNLNQNQNQKSKIQTQTPKNQTQKQNQNQKNQNQNQPQPQPQTQTPTPTPSDGFELPPASTPTLAQKQKRSQTPRKPVIKTVFHSPFLSHWPDISGKDQSEIIDLLSREFGIVGEKRKEVCKYQRMKKNFEKNQKLIEEITEPSSEPSLETKNQKILQQKENEQEKQKKKKPRPNPQPSIPIETVNQNIEEGNKSIKELCSKVVFGINEVTRALERNLLQLVIVCRDVEPTILVQHFPVLCFNKKAILTPLISGSHQLDKIFGLHSLAALGFKREAKDSPIVVAIERLTPPLSLPSKTLQPLTLLQLETTMPIKQKKPKTKDDNENENEKD